MGCRQVKPQETAPAEKVADNQNDVNAKPNLNQVSLDPRLPLDNRQVFKLKQSWKAIKRNMEQTGVEMFLRLFKTNSELKRMFSGFKHLEEESELRENEALEHHATLVMTTLDEAITHMDNYNFVTEVLQKTGGSHRRFTGFNSDVFWNIEGPFLEAVKITLGDRYTDNMENIYKVAIQFILQNLADGFKDTNKNLNHISSDPKSQ